MVNFPLIGQIEKAGVSQTMRPPFGDTTAAADGGTCKDALALPTGLVVY